MHVCIYSPARKQHTKHQTRRTARPRGAYRCPQQKCLDQILATTSNTTETKHNKNPSLINSGPERTNVLQTRKGRKLQKHNYPDIEYTCRQNTQADRQTLILVWLILTLSDVDVANAVSSGRGACTGRRLTHHALNTAYTGWL